MGDLSYIIDLIGNAGKEDKFKNYVSENFGESNPEFAAYAQVDPQSAMAMMPKLMLDKYSQNKEASAARDYFGVGQPDASGITWNKPDVSALARLQGLGQEAPIPQTLPTGGMSSQDNVLPSPNYDPQSRFDLTPEQTAALAIQNAQKSQSQADQARKVSVLGSLAPSLQSSAAQQLTMGDVSGGGSAGAIDKIAAQIANYKQAPLNGFVLKTPQGLAIQAKILDINPDYDANKFTALKKNEADMQVTGSMGQKLAQAQTAINHLAQYAKASEGMGGVNLGMASAPINAAINMWNNQTPDYQTAKRLQSMAGDEVAKFVAGSSGGTEADRKIQHELLGLNKSPEARKSAAQAAVQTMFGKLEPIADQYNRLHGTNMQPVDFLSPETKKSLSEIGMFPESGSEEKPSALAQMSKGSQITPEMARAELARRRNK